jgi:hypothetical protein
MGVVDYDDPGWAHVVKALLPWRWALRRRISETNGLASLRMAFGGVVLSLWPFALVLFMIQSSKPRSAPGRDRLVATVVLVVGAAAFLLIRWIRNRPLRHDDHSGLAESYRGSVLIGIALAETPALVGFTGSFFIADIWPYLLAAAISTGLLLWIAPGRREIERRQRQIQEQGSPLSLGAALVQAPAGQR